MRISGVMRRPQFFFCLLLLGCGANSTDRLVAQLGDDDPEVRRVAARALADQRGTSSEIIAALTQAAANSDVEVRQIAVEALAQKGSAAETVLPPLERALADPELSVRLKAALAIRKIDPESESYRPVLLDSLRAGHGTVFLEVGRMGTDAQWAVPTLVTVLSSDRRPSIRALAASTLGRIGASTSKVESALRRALRDQSPAVRTAAQQALGE